MSEVLYLRMLPEIWMASGASLVLMSLVGSLMNLNPLFLAPHFANGILMFFTGLGVKTVKFSVRRILNHLRGRQ